MVDTKKEEVKKKHRYKHSGGKRWVEVRIKNPLQLFDARDPSPFRERDLDDDFVEYINASANEFSPSIPLKVVIYIQEKETKELPKDSILEAIRSYYLYQIDLKKSELKAFAKRAQLFLLIGLTILILSVTIAGNLNLEHFPGLHGVLKEGFLIFGWVSFWRPIELILFDWYPLYEKISFYKKLLATEIEVIFEAA